jgi:hypothetical protein
MECKVKERQGKASEGKAWKVIRKVKAMHGMASDKARKVKERHEK